MEGRAVKKVAGTLELEVVEATPREGRHVQNKDLDFCFRQEKKMGF